MVDWNESIRRRRFAVCTKAGVEHVSKDGEDDDVVDTTDKSLAEIRVDVMVLLWLLLLHDVTSNASIVRLLLASIIPMSCDDTIGDDADGDADEIMPSDAAPLDRGQSCMKRPQVK